MLNEYRKKHAPLFASLSGKAALHHLIFSKTNWKLEYIRNLSLEDVLFIVSDEFVIDKLPTEAKEFLNTCELSEKMITLDSSLEADWDSKEIAVCLARMR
ncbi:ECs1072 family phage-associated protein [Symbiopectobacterium sp. Eva_TO]